MDLQGNWIEEMFTSEGWIVVEDKERFDRNERIKFLRIFSKEQNGYVYEFKIHSQDPNIPTSVRR